MRRAHFRLAAPRRFNGASEATVTITYAQGLALFAVRPLRRRHAYELPLETVAAWTIERCVKQEIAAKRKAKGGAQ